MHDVVFQQSVFQREKLKKDWPDFNKVISRGDEIAVAFEAVSAFPMWREDPRLANLPAETAREILDIYNEVIADGRYVAEFLEDPAHTAERRVASAEACFMCSKRKAKQGVLAVKGDVLQCPVEGADQLWPLV